MKKEQLRLILALPFLSFFGVLNAKPSLSLEKFLVKQEREALVQVEEKGSRKKKALSRAKLLAKTAGVSVGALGLLFFLERWRPKEKLMGLNKKDEGSAQGSKLIRRNKTLTATDTEEEKKKESKMKILETLDWISSVGDLPPEIRNDKFDFTLTLNRDQTLKNLSVEQLRKITNEILKRWKVRNEIEKRHGIGKWHELPLDIKKRWKVKAEDGFSHLKLEELKDVLKRLDKKKIISERREVLDELKSKYGIEHFYDISPFIRERLEFDVYAFPNLASKELEELRLAVIEEGAQKNILTELKNAYRVVAYEDITDFVKDKLKFAVDKFPYLNLEQTEKVLEVVQEEKNEKDELIKQLQEQYKILSHENIEEPVASLLEYNTQKYPELSWEEADKLIDTIKKVVFLKKLKSEHHIAEAAHISAFLRGKLNFASYDFKSLTAEEAKKLLTVVEEEANKKNKLLQELSNQGVEHQWQLSSFVLENLSFSHPFLLSARNSEQLKEILEQKKKEVLHKINRSPHYIKNSSDMTEAIKKKLKLSIDDLSELKAEELDRLFKELEKERRQILEELSKHGIERNLSKIKNLVKKETGKTHRRFKKFSSKELYGILCAVKKEVESVKKKILEKGGVSKHYFSSFTSTIKKEISLPELQEKLKKINEEPRKEILEELKKYYKDKSSIPASLLKRIEEKTLKSELENYSLEDLQKILEETKKYKQELLNELKENGCSSRWFIPYNIEEILREKKIILKPDLTDHSLEDLQKILEEIKKEKVLKELRKNGCSSRWLIPYSVQKTLKEKKITLKPYLRDHSLEDLQKILEEIKKRKEVLQKIKEKGCTYAWEIKPHVQERIKKRIGRQVEFEVEDHSLEDLQKILEEIEKG